MTLEGTLDVTVSDGTPSFALTVENAGTEPVTFQFMTGCSADFAVEADGTEVWRLTENRMFTQVISSETLEPGQQRTYEATGDSLDPGQYTAVGELAAKNHDCTARTDFSV
ncbi:BsuPI-related putative proteinase inhibitor [Halobacteria archaeon AArc-curdl1]|uniref:Intracellular proteinase inhibitor BsuPI domain-containing protein n=1 Tax=Natronosalvus hydrolyticus TaxID=2979988 RepID=A0AAP2Z8N5_9EURY|nr:BsuPI-related putative proteinase inhibitor [Halobacteria archaeon AArc-curdl1]